MDTEELKLHYTRKWKKMHAPFPMLILLLITLPWGVYIFQDERIWLQIARAGYTAIFFFAISFVLYLLLLAIRKLPRSLLTFSLVCFTRKYIQFHLPAALIGLFWIVMHVYWLIPYASLNHKTVTGALTLIIGLSTVFITGYLRKQKSSGKRRKFHRYASFVFIVFIVLHIISDK